MKVELFVHPSAAHTDEGDDAALQGAAAHACQGVADICQDGTLLTGRNDGEEGEQKHAGDLVKFAFRPARSGDLLQHVPQRV